MPKNPRLCGFLSLNSRAKRATSCVMERAYRNPMQLEKMAQQFVRILPPGERRGR